MKKKEKRHAGKDTVSRTLISYLQDNRAVTARVH